MLKGHCIDENLGKLNASLHMIFDFLVDVLMCFILSQVNIIFKTKTGTIIYGFNSRQSQEKFSHTRCMGILRDHHQNSPKSIHPTELILNYFILVFAQSLPI